MTVYNNLENTALLSYAAVEGSYPNFAERIQSAEEECILPCKGWTKTLEEHVRAMIGREEEKRIERAKRLRKPPYFSSSSDIVVKQGEVTVKGKALGLLKSFINYAQKKNNL
jgi:hypothetical protein